MLKNCKSFKLFNKNFIKTVDTVKYVKLIKKILTTITN